MELSREQLLRNLVKQGAEPSKSCFKVKIQDYLLNEFKLEETDLDPLHKLSQTLSKEIKQRWTKKGGRILDRTINSYPDYFSKTIDNPSPRKRAAIESPTGEPKPKGRPKMAFEDKNRTAKYKEINCVKKSSDSGLAMLYAGAQKLQDEGRKGDADFIKQIASNPGISAKVQSALEKPTPIPMDGDEGLEFLLRLKLTHMQYQEQRNEQIERNTGFLQPYYKVKESMNNALPNNIHYGNDEIVVSIQDVPNHQVVRLLDKEMIQRLDNLKSSDPSVDFILYYKYGADGMRRNSQYSHAGGGDQSSMFLSNLVILQLVAQCEDWTFVIYKNRLANSPFSVCPLRYKFETETRENSQREGDRLNHQAESTQPVFVPDSNISVSCHGNPTLINTKCRAAWCRENASTRCPVCGASPKQMSQRYGPFEPKPGTLKYGFSQLHVKLGMLRWCLKHGKYSPEVRYHEARGPENRRSVEREGLRQQTELEQIGLFVGNTMCGKHISTPM